MKISTIIFFFITSISFSQQRTLLKGRVLVENIPHSNVNIKNLSSETIDNNLIITNELGIFSIEVKEGDRLLFSSIDLDSLSISIKAENISGAEIKVSMNKKTYKLKEVTVNKMSAVSLGIIPKAIKERTPAERRLYTAGDFKYIHLLALLGGSMPLDPIINKINGRTKRLKKEVKIERKELNVKFFQENYQDYVINTLKIPEIEVNKFFFFIIDQDDVQNTIDSKNDSKIKFFLCNQLLNYKKTYLEE